MGSVNTKFSEEKFPDPNVYESVREVYQHLEANGFVFTPDQKPEGCLKMEMPEGWSFFKVNDKNWAILNPARIPEVIVFIDYLKTETEEESSSEEEDDGAISDNEEGSESPEEDVTPLTEEQKIENADRNLAMMTDVVGSKDVALNTIGLIPMALSVAALYSKLPPRPLNIKGVIVTGWEDPQIEKSLLRKITIPLPDFYQIVDSKMEFDEFHHLVLLKDQVKSLKYNYQSEFCCVSYYDKSHYHWNREYGPKLQRLRMFVNNKTNMKDYVEFQKYVNFLNRDLPKTHEEIYEYAMEKYRRYCQMSPGERQAINASHKLWKHTMDRSEIFDFSEGIDQDKLDWNPETIVFSRIVKGPEALK